MKTYCLILILVLFLMGSTGCSRPVVYVSNSTNVRIDAGARALSPGDVVKADDATSSGTLALNVDQKPDSFFGNIISWLISWFRKDAGA